MPVIYNPIWRWHFPLISNTTRGSRNWKIFILVFYNEKFNHKGVESAMSNEKSKYNFFTPQNRVLHILFWLKHSVYCWGNRYIQVKSSTKMRLSVKLFFGFLRSYLFWFSLQLTNYNSNIFILIWFWSIIDEKTFLINK